MEKITISNSQVGTWIRCARQWEFRYIKGLKIPPSGAMHQGSSYHNALKANFQHKIDTKEDLRISDVLDAYDTYWSKQEEEVNWEGAKPGDLKDEGIRLVSLYHKNMAPNIVPEKVEDYAEKQIGEDIKFIGYIDLETSDRLIDHKLRGRSMTQNDADSDTQPLSYCFLKDKYRFDYHVAIKKKMPEIQLLQVNKTIADIEWYVKMVEQIVGQIRSGYAPPNPVGWHCNPKFCGYFSLCKEMK